MQATAGTAGDSRVSQPSQPLHCLRHQDVSSRSSLGTNSQHSDETIEPSCVDIANPPGDPETDLCRVCWGEADCECGGALVAPCECKGSLRFLHARCLDQWQNALTSAGRHKKSRTCEICKQPYKLHPLRYMQGRGAWRMRLASTLFGFAVVRSVKVGASGLHSAVTLGRSMVKEQAQVIIKLLTTLASTMGSPYAELMFGQAFPAVAFALASEFAYFCLVGISAGAVCSFMTYYLRAAVSSISLAFPLYLAPPGVIMTLTLLNLTASVNVDKESSTIVATMVQSES
eukprot:gene22530-29653_t